MRRNEVICQIIIKSGLAKTYPQALSMFVQTFVENFRHKSLDSWDTHVSPELAELFMKTIEKKGEVNIYTLINELDSFLKKSKLSLIFMICCQLFFHSHPR